MDKLILNCDVDLNYTLTAEGEAWERRFSTMYHALNYAQGIVQGETAIVVYSGRGTVIIESSIFPKGVVRIS